MRLPEEANRWRSDGRIIDLDLNAILARNVVSEKPEAAHCDDTPVHQDGCVPRCRAFAVPLDNSCYRTLDVPLNDPVEL